MTPVSGQDKEQDKAAQDAIRTAWAWLTAPPVKKHPWNGAGAVLDKRTHFTADTARAALAKARKCDKCGKVARKGWTLCTRHGGGPKDAATPARQARAAVRGLIRAGVIAGQAGTNRPADPVIRALYLSGRAAGPVLALKLATAIARQNEDPETLYKARSEAARFIAEYGLNVRP